MSGGRTRKKVSISSVIVTVLVVLAIIAVAGALVLKYIRNREATVLREVNVQTGCPVYLNIFFVNGDVPERTSFITDVSGIDTSVPGSYGLKINMMGFEEDVILNVTDSVIPTAEAVPQTVYTGRLPDPAECVTGIKDNADVTVSFLEEEPDISAGGEKLIPVKLEDSYGNVNVIHVPFTIVDDHTPPLIYGPHDMEYFIGDTIIYRDGITVTDNYDPDPELTIDTSNVNATEDGVYPVIYSAKDEYGNETSTTVYLTLRTMPEDYVEPEIVYALAQEVLDEITGGEELSDIEIGFRIMNWCRNYIHYVGTSNKNDWTVGAYDGFTTLQGDCFTYYACAKALFDVAGIENLCVERYPAENSCHYWNLVYLDGQWYHCDSSPSFEHDGYWYMRTDAELDWSHRFDTEGDLPPRATESVQDRLDFYNMTIREEEDD